MTPIRYQARREIKCLGCGCRLVRQRTFSAVPQAGETNAAVLGRLQAQEDAWKPQGRCVGCTTEIEDVAG